MRFEGPGDWTPARRDRNGAAGIYKKIFTNFFVKTKKTIEKEAPMTRDDRAKEIFGSMLPVL